MGTIQTIGVLFGGRSGEHEVSIVSANTIIGALQRKGYTVLPIGITKEGRWLTGEGILEALKRGETEGFRSVGLLGDPTQPGLHYTDGSNEIVNLDIIFPALHGPWGEDGTVQGLLELANIPYVGCGVLASSLGMDKALSKRMFQQAGIPQVPYQVILRKDWEAQPDQVLNQLEAALGYPVFVKPANLGSSVGISKAKDRTQLVAALQEAARFDRKLVVEKGLNIREIEVAVLGNDEVQASVPGEIIPDREFYDYSSKYDSTSTSEPEIPAQLTTEQTETIRSLAVRTFQAIDGAGLARVDFFIEQETGAIYLNEINTLPGFTSISMYPKMWEAAGIPLEELVERLVQLAVERFQDNHR